MKNFTSTVGLPQSFRGRVCWFLKVFSDLSSGVWAGWGRGWCRPEVDFPGLMEVSSGFRLQRPWAQPGCGVGVGRAGTTFSFRSPCPTQQEGGRAAPAPQAPPGPGNSQVAPAGGTRVCGRKAFVSKAINTDKYLGGPRRREGSRGGLGRISLRALPPQGNSSVHPHFLYLVNSGPPAPQETPLHQAPPNHPALPAPGWGDMIRKTMATFRCFCWTCIHPSPPPQFSSGEPPTF